MSGPEAARNCHPPRTFEKPKQVAQARGSTWMSLKSWGECGGDPREEEKGRRQFPGFREEEKTPGNSPTHRCVLRRYLHNAALQHNGQLCRPVLCCTHTAARDGADPPRHGQSFDKGETLEKGRKALIRPPFSSRGDRIAGDDRPSQSGTS